MKIILILFLFFTIKIQAQVIPVAFMKSSISFDYPTVDIGGQQWMTDNLDVVNYRNGDPRPQVTDQTTWKNLTTGAWCYYNNDAAYGAIYGKLYNWYAVNDPRGLAPEGWHIPTDAEWTTLGTFLGGNAVAGGKLKSTGTSVWNSPNTDATNSSGFKGLPGGVRGGNGAFYDIVFGGSWWSASEINSTISWFRNLDYNNSILHKYSDKKYYGLSVRLIKD
jgi:uncharacterized protein (TIGR02145 family)